MRKRMESDALILETISSSTHLLIAYLDTEFNFIRVNRSYAEADQRSPDQFVGRNHFDLYPDEENEAVFRKVSENRVCDEKDSLERVL